ncbi:MAG: PstS family phosphate ABC transporter substrate-binding protein [Thainema sp.]
MVVNTKQFLAGAIAGLSAAVGISTVAIAQTPSIDIDGSSTVFPVTEAVAEEFMQDKSGQVNVTVGVSGTGGGFSRFCAGETVISNASRPIKQEEMEACSAAGIEYIEIPVATDALTVVVNPANTWATEMTMEQLQMIWQPDSTISTWSDVDPSWPNEEISLYGPGPDSGTFDYFTDEVVGEEGASRTDYIASEDDNVLVLGVEGDEYSLGYFGYAYYIENADQLQAVAVDSGNGPVAPSPETVESGAYTPLSRPLFIYVSKNALESRPEVREFVEFYLETAPDLVAEVGYIPLSAERYAEAMAGL